FHAKANARRLGALAADRRNVRQVHGCFALDNARLRADITRGFLMLLDDVMTRDNDAVFLRLYGMHRTPLTALVAGQNFYHIAFFDSCSHCYLSIQYPVFSSQTVALNQQSGYWLPTTDIFQRTSGESE